MKLFDINVNVDSEVLTTLASHVKSQAVDLHGPDTEFRKFKKTRVLNAFEMKNGAPPKGVERHFRHGFGFAAAFFEPQGRLYTVTAARERSLPRGSSSAIRLTINACPSCTKTSL